MEIKNDETYLVTSVVSLPEWKEVSDCSKVKLTVQLPSLHGDFCYSPPAA